MDPRNPNEITALGLYELSKHRQCIGAMMYQKRTKKHIEPEDLLEIWKNEGFVRSPDASGGYRHGTPKTSLFAAHVEHKGNFPKMLQYLQERFNTTEYNLLSLCKKHKLPVEDVPLNIQKPKSLRKQPTREYVLGDRMFRKRVGRGSNKRLVPRCFGN
jgi:hypothetical protein